MKRSRRESGSDLFIEKGCLKDYFSLLKENTYPSVFVFAILETFFHFCLVLLEVNGSKQLSHIEKTSKILKDSEL